MDRQEIERQKERKKGGKVRKYSTFLLGCLKCSMNGRKKKKSEERSGTNRTARQKNLRETGNLVASCPLNVLSFLTPFTIMWKQYMWKKQQVNGLLMHRVHRLITEP